jgi:hypothetical protein
MAKRLKLRRFLYLDGDLTNEYLAQFEGGVYDEEEQSTASRSRRGAEGGVRAGPLTAGATGDSEAEEESSRLMRQTDESAFTRLTSTLEESDQVQWLESLDNPIWEQLERGEVLEIECSISVPKLVSFMVVAMQIGTASELMDVMGEKLDPESAQGLQALMAIANMFDSIPVVASALGTPEYKFVAPLNGLALRVPIDQIAGEARLFCTLDRRLRQGEEYTVLDAIPAMRSLPNRAEIDEGLREVEELADDAVEPPAAVVTPIAIYR